jgi:hypothetical protein
MMIDGLSSGGEKKSEKIVNDARYFLLTLP